MPVTKLRAQQASVSIFISLSSIFLNFCHKYQELCSLLFLPSSARFLLHLLSGAVALFFRAVFIADIRLHNWCQWKLKIYDYVSFLYDFSSVGRHQAAFKKRKQNTLLVFMFLSLFTLNSPKERVTILPVNAFSPPSLSSSQCGLTCAVIQFSVHHDSRYFSFFCWILFRSNIFLF